MGISPIRRYTPEDVARVRAAAHRMLSSERCYDAGEVEAHPMDEVAIWIDSRPEYQDSRRTRWQRALCRAFRVPYDRQITVAYNYIGREVR